MKTFKIAHNIRTITEYDVVSGKTEVIDTTVTVAVFNITDETAAVWDITANSADAVTSIDAYRAYQIIIDWQPEVAEFGDDLEGPLGLLTDELALEHRRLFPTEELGGAWVDDDYDIFYATIPEHTIDIRLDTDQRMPVGLIMAALQARR